MAEFDRDKAIEAQKKYCAENRLPRFAPDNGWCRCGKNIYERHLNTTFRLAYYSGISVEQAGEELITGCPHCQRTYCD